MPKVLVAFVLVVAFVLPAAPALAAEGCGPAGGATIPPAQAEPGDFRVTGGGSGHGAGMSQYGAQGAAKLGCDADTILGTYYPGAAVEAVPMPAGIKVNLDSAATTTAVTGVSGSVPWELCTNGACDTLPVRLEAGRTWTVAVLADGGYRITDGATEVWRGGDRYALLRARLSASEGDNRIVRLANRYRWGLLEFDSVVGDAASFMFVTLDIAPFDRYLYGLGEVPSSWPEEALKAQVVAARSYALLRVERGLRESCRCHVLSTTADQNYTGYEKESEGSTGQYGARWRAAVDATRAADFSTARVLRHGGATADAYYSSSHAGYSESARFVFGSERPYIQPVDDSRWELASDNPVRTWSRTLSAADLGRALGVGVAQSVTLPEPRGVACRVGHPSRGYGGVVVRGTTGERTLTGDDVRRALGLRSTLFTINGTDEERAACPTAGADPGPAPAPPPPPPPEPTPAPPADPVFRLAGTDRVGTGAEVARWHWEDADEVLLATARSFPDALAAAALAGRRDAPVLLTEPDALPAAVAEQLQRLDPETVTILGGEGAISRAVGQQVRDAGFEARRVAGPDRYATAAAIAVEAGPAADGAVALALGSDFPDALAAGALAATPDPLPVLLTGRDALPEATVAALAELGTRTVVLVGGEAAIPEAIAQRLRELGYAVERVAGPNRFATSAAATRAALARLGDGARPVVLATGQDYPDALAAGALAAKVDGPLQLVPGGDLADAPDAAAVLREYAAVLERGIIVGGSGAVGDRVAEQVSEAINA